MADGIRRRSRGDMLCPAERAIHDAIELVEQLGAAPALTDAVVHLSEAKDCVADYIDGFEQETTQ